MFCRVKPHKDPTARCLPGNTSLSLLCDGKENPFTFDRVFDPNVTQQQVSYVMRAYNSHARSSLDVELVCRPLSGTSTAPGVMQSCSHTVHFTCTDIHVTH